MGKSVYKAGRPSRGGQSRKDGFIQGFLEGVLYGRITSEYSGTSRFVARRHSEHERAGKRNRIVRFGMCVAFGLSLWFPDRSALGELVPSDLDTLEATLAAIQTTSEITEENIVEGVSTLEGVGYEIVDALGLTQSWIEYYLPDLMLYSFRQYDALESIRAQVFAGLAITNRVSVDVANTAKVFVVNWPSVFTVTGVVDIAGAFIGDDDTISVSFPDVDAPSAFPFYELDPPDTNDWNVSASNAWKWTSEVNDQVAERKVDITAAFNGGAVEIMDRLLDPFGAFFDDLQAMNDNRMLIGPYFLEFVGGGLTLDFDFRTGVRKTLYDFMHDASGFVWVIIGLFGVFQGFLDFGGVKA